MRSQSVGGIDPSSKKLVIVESRRHAKRKPFIHSIMLDAERPEDRVQQGFNFVFEWGMGVRERDGVPPRIYLEAPVMGVGGPGATIPQAFVEGGIMVAASQLDSWFTLVNNQSWKKRVLGNGATPKHEIAPLVKGIWPEFYKKVPIIDSTEVKPEWRGKPDQDMIDAGCINMYGWWHTTLFERLQDQRRRNA